jgi:hypothetical protein
MIGRIARIAGLSLIVALATSFGIGPATAAQEATGTPPSYWPEGISSVTLAHSGPGTLGSNSSLVLVRLTYQPGSSYQFVRPYPVLIFVESGSIFFGMDGDHVSIGLTQDSASSESAGVVIGSSSSGIDLVAGYSLSSKSGNVGTTRNDGSVPAVLTVVGVVTPPSGSTECGSDETTAGIGTQVVDSPEECHAT